ncbi:hypothetical protein P3G55_26330, partial [Leptospira sp. 96542]|nr:hypothetical protein [Leptospira sp. 96542]
MAAKDVTGTTSAPGLPERAVASNAGSKATTGRDAVSSTGLVALAAGGGACVGKVAAAACVSTPEAVALPAPVAWPGSETPPSATRPEAVAAGTATGADASFGPVSRLTADANL